MACRSSSRISRSRTPAAFSILCAIAFQGGPASRRGPRAATAGGARDGCPGRSPAGVAPARRPARRAPRRSTPRLPGTRRPPGARRSASSRSAPLPVSRLGALADPDREDRAERRPLHVLQHTAHGLEVDSLGPVEPRENFIQEGIPKWNVERSWSKRSRSSGVSDDWRVPEGARVTCPSRRASRGDRGQRGREAARSAPVASQHLARDCRHRLKRVPVRPSAATWRALGGVVRQSRALWDVGARPGGSGTCSRTARNH
jgi:hypothetical protein